MITVQIQDDESGSRGASALVIILCVISVALRFYTRTFTRAGLKADDWLILVAVVGTLLTAALLIWGNTIYPGSIWISEDTDSDYDYKPDAIFVLKLNFVASSLYFTVSGATKLGILSMYYRIFAASTSFRYLIFIAGGLVIGWWVGCTIANLTDCIPIKANWIKSAELQHCFNFNIFWMASGVCEIFLDVLILTLPIAAVVRMRLSLRQKVLVSGIFLLGGFVIITGIVRVAFGYQPGSRYPSYTNAGLWSEVHAGMAIICASLPIFKPLVNRISGSRLITKISSIQLLWRSGESLRSNPDRVTLKPRPCESSEGNENYDRMKISPLTTIGGTPMHESGSSKR
ncbi:hypothetical protein M434DRAFT_29146 [Hypoxylon sp. CO27-5]|nr:hypothetical protein M434DRAFT_29146 [Hypoxylon sp. CO27-5]